MKHRTKSRARLIRNSLIASTLAAMLQGGSVRAALAHSHSLENHLHQSERSQRRSFRDKLVSAASRFSTQNLPMASSGIPRAENG
jgi:hypothetical protein